MGNEPQTSGEPKLMWRKTVDAQEVATSTTDGQTKRSFGAALGVMEKVGEPRDALSLLSSAEQSRGEGRECWEFADLM